MGFFVEFVDSLIGVTQRPLKFHGRTALRSFAAEVFLAPTHPVFAADSTTRIVTALRFARFVPVVAALLGACRGRAQPPSVAAIASAPPSVTSRSPIASAPDSAVPVATSPRAARAHLPLVLAAEVPLPGAAVRFDYQEVDAEAGQLVIAHMNDAAVLVLDLHTGALRARLAKIPTPRGVAIAHDRRRIFVTSSPARLVIIDQEKLTEIARVPTGNAPDGVAYDPADALVAVSDQRDGAISLIADAGSGQRRHVALGSETGNVVFDAQRRCFWITVAQSKPPDELIAIDARAQSIARRVPLPGCHGAHGLRLHPNGASAFIACEEDDTLVRVALDGASPIVSARTGSGPDVLAIDAGLGWLYVAAESGELTVFDIAQPGLALLGREHPGDHAHSVAVDPATHRVFFPLLAGSHGQPVLRIFRPQ